MISRAETRKYQQENLLLKRQIEERTGKGVEQLYAERVKRVRDAIELKEPDRIPITVFPDAQFRITSHVNFPHPLVGRQMLELPITPEAYAREIAPARTFGFADQLPQMKEMGLIRGGSLANAVVFDQESVMNAEGLRFPDECCRHKILDLIGDLALTGYPLLGHVVAEHAGHAMHTALVLKLMKHRSLWELTDGAPVSGTSAEASEAVAVGQGASD